MRTTFPSSALQFIGSDLTKLFSFCLIVITLAVTSTQSVFAQDEEDEPIVVQVYDVSEFVTQKSDHPFDGFVIPGISDFKEGFFNGHVGSGVGFGGGATGGGQFNIAPFGPPQLGGGGGGQFGGQAFVQHAAPQQLTTDDLADVIMDSVANDSWSMNGAGAGRITFMGSTTMIVSHTQAVHSQIEALLKMLGQTKASTKNQSVVTINAIWLTIDETQFATLNPKSDRSVDKEVLDRLTKEYGRRGQITCFDGQRVHIAAGNLRSSVDTVIPVVGQIGMPGDDVKALAKTNPLADLPDNVSAQVPMDGVAGPNKIGYKPVPRWTNYGTVLQVLPRIEADRQIWLDVGSIIVRPGQASTKMKMGQIEIDKHNMYCQQFTTSIRVNDSTPTLVGGSAFDTAPESKLQTYLILEASKVVKPVAE
ncbi:hypothetical protein N9Y42_00420 [Mariniblastus sp.]|nr:hypothetical protein [Mariniblastus sp.]